MMTASPTPILLLTRLRPQRPTPVPRPKPRHPHHCYNSFFTDGHSVFKIVGCAAATGWMRSA